MDIVFEPLDVGVGAVGGVPLSSSLQVNPRIVGLHHRQGMTDVAQLLASQEEVAPPEPRDLPPSQDMKT